ncbi:MAG TPA: peptide chain release factor N(5)-glutamine methyltransferase [Candidatus Polarisedimenticolia bacterium]|nr:peptide chain release factor N(5)-glutamine methyltransferase [Candidatus Polarisedimenticolia bacterium]
MSSAPSVRVRDLILHGAAYLESRGVPGARFDAQVLLARTLGVSRSDLLLRRDAIAPEASRGRYEELLRRRGGRVPLQHLTGVQEFWSLEFEVGPAVLIPRPETELLVEEALRRAGGPAPRLADIGTGSGNLAVALARELPSAAVLATDISEAALEVARRNAARHGTAERIRFLLGDLARPLEGVVEPGSLDLLLSNPPYVSETELASLEPEVRDHEPRAALVPPGGQTWALYPALLEAASRYLLPGGHVILEISGTGADGVAPLMAGRDGFELVMVRPDYSGLPRVLVARRRG